MKSRKLSPATLKLSILATLALGGCLTTTLPAYRAEVAQRIAAPAWMLKRQVPAAPFALTVFERIHKRGGVANVYIAGDGDVWTSPREWKDNPTPQNPVGLHLASKDDAQNVIYIARPCQYSGMMDRAEDCPPALWHEARYGQQVINSVNAALDEMALRYDLRGFNLIGYAGGGTVASLLATRRTDILSLRTVAGVMDHKAQSAALQAPVLTQSLNPVDEADKLSHVPQYHFIGGQDKYVPPAVLHSYLQALPPTRCVQYDMIQEAGYEDGWVDKWPELLKRPVNCKNSENNLDDIDLLSEPVKKEPLYPIPEKPAKP
ncbi:MAG: hypothetical protein KDI13_07550 [Alphaproteobacteria bacterium]|nr:hypothetical protein [Alphaproteobacteria bacterium]